MKEYFTISTGSNSNGKATEDKKNKQKYNSRHIKLVTGQDQGLHLLRECIFVPGNSVWVVQMTVFSPSPLHYIFIKPQDGGSYILVTTTKWLVKLIDEWKMETDKLKIDKTWEVPTRHRNEEAGILRIPSKEDNQKWCGWRIFRDSLWCLLLLLLLVSWLFDKVLLFSLVWLWTYDFYVSAPQSLELQQHPIIHSLRDSL